MTKQAPITVAALGSIAATAFLAGGMPIPMTDAPLGRVVANLEARLKEQPNNPNIHYQLGRAHALAFVTKRDTIRGYEAAAGFEPLPPDWQDYRPRPSDQSGTELTKDEVAGHLVAGVDQLARAIRIKPEARYYLALASLLETAGDNAVNLDVALVLPPSGSAGLELRPDGTWGPVETDAYVRALPDENAAKVVRARVFDGTLDVAGSGSGAFTLRDVWRSRDDAARGVAARAILAEFWRELTRDSYFIAFSLALAKEAKADDRPGGSVGLRISLEAAKAFKRLAPAAPKRDEGLDDSARIQIVETAITELSKQQMVGGITPIILSVAPGASAADLISPAARIEFDLDGTGLPQAWSWVRPEAGILVWDPAVRGRVSSGRQLFGSVTWWVMFDDGYQALDTLDDNRDGNLAGRELRGLAVWFDRGGDGVSDPGEVVAVESIGIVSIATRGVSEDCGFLANHTGARFADGRVVPTFDWIATPVARPDGSLPPPQVSLPR